MLICVYGPLAVHMIYEMIRGSKQTKGRKEGDKARNSIAHPPLNSTKVFVAGCLQFPLRCAQG